MVSTSRADEVGVGVVSTSRADEVGVGVGVIKTNCAAEVGVGAAGSGVGVAGSGVNVAAGTVGVGVAGSAVDVGAGAAGRVGMGVDVIKGGTVGVGRSSPPPGPTTCVAEGSCPGPGVCTSRPALQPWDSASAVAGPEDPRFRLPRLPGSRATYLLSISSIASAKALPISAMVLAQPR